MPPLLLVDDDTDVVGVWRARAELAEARAERAEERLAEALAKIDKLSEAEERLPEALARIDKLSAQVAMLSRMLFGQSSEQSQRRTQSGSADEPEAGCPPAGGGGDQKRPRGQQPGSRGHGRRDYTHLATEEVVLDVPADARCCAECGIEFECVDSEFSEQIDWRVTITRIVYRRPRYRRRCGCPGSRSAIAPPAANVVPKGRFTPGFLARLLYDKYVLGLPLHRIVRGLAADGLEVSEGTLTGAMRLVWARLQPLVEAIAEHNKTAGHLHADETSWRVFADTPGKDGHKWWLWVFCAADSVVFVMDPTRSAAVLESHLGIDRADGKLPDGRQLVLSTDFYVAYQSLARMDGVHPLWCWAHIRRYFLRGRCSTPRPTRRSPRRCRSWTPPARKKPRFTVCGPRPVRFWPPWSASGTVWSPTATSPTSILITMSRNARCGPRSWAARTSTAARPTGPPTSPPGSGPSPRPPSATAASPWPTSPITSTPAPPPAATHRKATTSTGSYPGNPTPMIPMVAATTTRHR